MPSDRGSSTHPRRYRTCRRCGLQAPPRVLWGGLTLFARCPSCGSGHPVPVCWPWVELAERADCDPLLALYERRTIQCENPT